MNRQTASSELRKLLDDNGLSDWHVRLTTDATKPFLGMCSYKDKCIILNAHHIDIHDDIEVMNTIRHEVAHALVGPNHGHDNVWSDKAKALGCINTEPCMAYGLSPEAIDAIRSGAELIVTFEEQTIRKPKYEVRKLQDKCGVCGKVLVEKSRVEFKSGNARWLKITYECGHIKLRKADSQTNFESFITFAHRNNGCEHEWNKNTCINCGANRPFNFQIEGMRALEQANGRLGIFDEMGLGKTIQTLGYFHFHPECLPALYIVKSGIKYQWLQAIMTWLGPGYFGQVFSTSKENFLPGLKTYIVSYDILRRLSTEQIDSLIEKVGIKSIVLDECQQIKNPDSSRTQEVRKLVKKVKYVIPLSGTPWKNRGSEFFVALNMLAPSKFNSFEGFKNQWVDYYWDGNKYKEGGIRAPQRFKEYVKDILIRRERSQVMPELPTISRNKLIVEVPEHARAAYKEAEDKLVKDWNNIVISGEEDTFDAHRKVMENLIVMRQIVGIAKVPGTIEFVQEFLEETDRKLVVFVHHHTCSDMIYDQMRDWCAKNDQPTPLKLTAALSSEERFNVQQQFNGNGHRLMVASTLASGEGLNLQTCSDCVMHERQWNPANEEQAEGRFVRIGQQSNAVIATYVHGDETIDTTLDGLVERKRVQFHHAMNKGEMPTWNEQGLVKELVNAIVASRKK